MPHWSLGLRIEWSVPGRSPTQLRFGLLSLSFPTSLVYDSIDLKTNVLAPLFSAHSSLCVFRSFPGEYFLVTRADASDMLGPPSSQISILITTAYLAT
jgi:hypothetical protein